MSGTYLLIILLIIELAFDRLQKHSIDWVLAFHSCRLSLKRIIAAMAGKLSVDGIALVTGVSRRCREAQ